jgi:hypothetical protein
MAGMVPTVMALKARIPSAADPMSPSFWFVMSMGLLVGFIIAYPRRPGEWVLFVGPLCFRFRKTGSRKIRNGRKVLSNSQRK